MCEIQPMASAKSLAGPRFGKSSALAPPGTGYPSVRYKTLEERGTQRRASSENDRKVHVSHQNQDFRHCVPWSVVQKNDLDPILLFYIF